MKDYGTHPLIRQDWVDVGDGHQLFLAQYGDPQGIPVLYLHGGPGAGCSDAELKLFNDNDLCIYMLDQRASGRSRSMSITENNDLLCLLNDIETVRCWAKVDSWCLLGGSFGATLGYLYSCIYPTRVRSQVYWGMFIPSHEGVEWLYGRGGAAQIFSSQYRQFNPEGVSKLGLLFEQFEHGFFARQSDIRDKYINRWLAWELELAAPGLGFNEIYVDEWRVLARIELHYAKNCYFGAYPLMQQMGANVALPTVILQGELDWVCPQVLVDEFLAQFGPKGLFSRLVKGGHHALTDDSMCNAITYAVQKMISDIKRL